MELEEWMRGLKISARTRNNLRTSTNTLFSFAQQRGYLSKNIPTEAEALSKAKALSLDVAIFSPEQVTKLMRSATKEMIPFIALGAFAGLRSAEIHRLGWDAVRFEEDIIEIKAGQAKNASRRVVPLEPNLKAWLRLEKGTGLIIKDKALWKKVTTLGKKLDLGWPQNVLRHSYISYRVSRDKNVNAVALDSGNSTQIIFKHYHQLTTEPRALEWFAVSPIAATPPAIAP